MEEEEEKEQEEEMVVSHHGGVQVCIRICAFGTPGVEDKEK